MTSSTISKVSEMIRARQSIYPNCFTGELVSDEQIWELLENANCAPSHRNTEPWRFHVIPRSKTDSFADFYQAAYKSFVPSEKFNQKKYDKIRKKADAASHILIVTMQRDPSGILPEWEEIAAVACAVQNIYLSLRPMGLGGYWSTPAAVIDNISEFVDLKVGERCLGLFYIGIPQNELPPQVKKGDVAGKVNWLE